MQTKHLCVVIHIWFKGEVWPWETCVSLPLKYFYWPFLGGASFVDHSCYSGVCLLCFCVRLFSCCLVVTCWERPDLLALVCDVLLWVCYFPIGILGQVWYLIVSIPDLCPFLYFGYPLIIYKFKCFFLRRALFMSYIFNAYLQVHAQVYPVALDNQFWDWTFIFFNKICV